MPRHERGLVEGEVIVRDGGFIEPILAFSGWYTARRQDEILADRLAALEAA